MSDPIVTLEERLHAHPVLKKSVEALLQIVEEPSQEIATADEAELRVIEALISHHMRHSTISTISHKIPYFLDI